MIRMIDIRKSYSTDITRVEVLRGVSLDIRKGEFISVMGASGSGKSTLLNIMGLLDTYDAGDYFVGGKLVKNLPEREAALYRSRTFGFVFQSSCLISCKNVLENVSMPLIYQGLGYKESEKAAMACLERLGLADRVRHFPNELSGGQKQRVAIARAIVSNPPVLLADEPTGQLDSVTTWDVMDVLKGINRDSGTTVVVVTHEKAIAEETQRIIHIKDGLVCC